MAQLRRGRRGDRPSSLTGRLAMLSAGAVAVFAVGGVVVLRTEADVRAADAAQVRLNAVRVATYAVEAAYVDQETGLRGYVITGQEEQLAPLHAANYRLPELTSSLREDLTEAGVAPDRFVAVEAAHRDWWEYASAVVDQVEEGDLEAARGRERTSRGTALFDTLRVRTKALQDELSTRGRANQDRVSQLQTRLLVLLVVQMLLLVALVVAAFLALWRQVSGPVVALSRASRRVTDGDLTAPLPQTGAREIRALGADVRAMRDRLTADLHATRQALAALEQAEPALAALGRALHSSVPTPALRTGRGVDGVQVTGRLDATDGVLAGDWYDVVDVTPTRRAIVVGDVAGHGPLSAVLALQLKHALAGALATGADPARALSVVAARLGDPDEDLADELFATLFIAVCDTERHVLLYAGAGHPAALLRRVGTDWVELPATGPLLASLTRSMSWHTVQYPFHVGDELLVTTDGVLEARDGDGVEFGAEGVLRVLAEVGTTRPGQAIDAVMAGALRHVPQRGRRDDQTLVHVRRV